MGPVCEASHIGKFCYFVGLIYIATVEGRGGFC